MHAQQVGRVPFAAIKLPYPAVPHYREVSIGDNRSYSGHSALCIACEALSGCCSGLELRPLTNLENEVRSNKWDFLQVLGQIIAMEEVFHAKQICCRAKWKKRWKLDCVAVWGPCDVLYSFSNTWGGASTVPWRVTNRLFCSLADYNHIFSNAFPNCCGSKSVKIFLIWRQIKK